MSNWRFCTFNKDILRIPFSQAKLYQMTQEFTVLSILHLEKFNFWLPTTLISGSYKDRYHGIGKIAELEITEMIHQVKRLLFKLVKKVHVNKILSQKS